jgi:hypothetical protein
MFVNDFIFYFLFYALESKNINKKLKTQNTFQNTKAVFYFYITLLHFFNNNNNSNPSKTH